MKLLKLIAIMGLAILTTACGMTNSSTPVNKADKEIILVSAAASLQDALNEIRAKFIKEKGLKEEQVLVNYGGSGTLRKQIEEGAGASLFISAATNHMKALEEKQLVDKVHPLVKNELVLIVPKGRPSFTLDTIMEVKRLAIGDPTTVPAGKYAVHTLEASQVWEKVEPKVVYGKDVRSVLAYVSEGTVEAGFVYKTDALLASDKVVVTDQAPDGSHEPILYPMAIVKKKSNALTEEFYRYLLTDESQKLLQSYGFRSYKD